MKKVLFLTNYPSPYRVDFFNLLGKSVDLTVLFTEDPQEQKHRNKAWFNQNYLEFNAVFLERFFTIHKKKLFLDVIDFLKKGWDVIITGGYSDPTQMLAFEWLEKHHIPFYMELDGGLIQNDGYIKKLIKKHYISMPNGWFSTGNTADEYLIHYGAKSDRIIHYPFTSLWASEIEKAKLAAKVDKQQVRENLGIPEQNVVLAVGQFVPRKGFDVLVRAAALLGQKVGVYIIGGRPTEEYDSLRKQVNANNVHFVDFKPKEKLKQFYLAANVFAMPTRRDVWGLVINEALCFGLPVVSTDQCGAALELVKNGENGYVIPADDHVAMAHAITKALNNMNLLSDNAFTSIEKYSIENMVKAHLDSFDG